MFVLFDKARLYLLYERACFDVWVGGYLPYWLHGILRRFRKHWAPFPLEPLDVNMPPRWANWAATFEAPPDTWWRRLHLALRGTRWFSPWKLEEEG